jgi:hypothetical protein
MASQWGEWTHGEGQKALFGVEQTPGYLPYNFANISRGPSAVPRPRQPQPSTELARTGYGYGYGRSTSDALHASYGAGRGFQRPALERGVKGELMPGAPALPVSTGGRVPTMPSPGVTAQLPVARSSMYSRAIPARSYTAPQGVTRQMSLF